MDRHDQGNPIKTPRISNMLYNRTFLNHPNIWDDGFVVVVVIVGESWIIYEDKIS